MLQKISLLFLFVFLFTGCSKFVAVTGTVKLTDGTPLSGGNVIFIGGNSQAKGTIDANGKYSMSFQKRGDGVPPGDYTVLITGAFFTPENLKVDDDMDTGTRPMLDPKYYETETTPLTCSVPNPDGYDFTVEPSKEYLASKKKN